MLYNEKTKQYYTVSWDYFHKVLSYVLTESDKPDWRFIDSLFSHMNERHYDVMWRLMDASVKSQPASRRDFYFKRLAKSVLDKLDRPYPEYLELKYIIPQSKPEVVVDSMDINSILGIDDTRSCNIFKKFFYNDRLILVGYDSKKVVEERYNRSNYNYFIALFMPDTRKHEVIRLSADVLDDNKWRFIESSSEWSNYRNGTSVFGLNNVLFIGEPEAYLCVVQGNGKIFLYSKKEKRWRLAFEHNEEIQASAFDNGKLYLGTGERFSGSDGTKREKLGGAIYEYDVKTWRRREIVSYRRCPAQSPMDNIGSFKFEALVMTSGGNLIPFIRKGANRSAYRYNVATKAWKVIVENNRLLDITNDGANFLVRNRSRKDYSWDCKLIPSSDPQKEVTVKSGIVDRWIFCSDQTIYRAGRALFTYNTETGTCSSLPLPATGYGRHMYATKNNLFFVWSDHLSAGIHVIPHSRIEEYRKNKLQTPVISPNTTMTRHSKYEEFTFSKKIDITLKTVDKGAGLYYTLDGSTPNKNAKLYTKPFVVTESMTVKAVAVKKGTLPSDVRCITYTRKNRK